MAAQSTHPKPTEHQQLSRIGQNLLATIMNLCGDGVGSCGVRAKPLVDTHNASSPSQNTCFATHAQDSMFLISFF